MDDASTTPPDALSARPVYSESQIQAYLDFIEFPASLRSIPKLDRGQIEPPQSKEHGLPFLTALMRYQLAKVPFENLVLHYSPHQEASLDPQDLIEQIIANKSNRGGHCLQLNAFFGTVLRSFNFAVMSSAARVNSDIEASRERNQESRYKAWNHMINVVTLSNERYLVDVGVGAHGPAVPIPLSEDHSPLASMVPRSIRLVKDFIPESTSHDPNHKYWRLQERYSDNKPWTQIYAFADIEFIPADFEVIKWFINANRASWFTHKIMVSKMLLSPNREEIIGSLTLFEKELKKRTHDSTETISVCKTENERISVLKEYFDITLSVREQRSIQGTASEIA